LKRLRWIITPTKVQKKKLSFKPNLRFAISIIISNIIGFIIGLIIFTFENHTSVFTLFLIVLSGLIGAVITGIKAKGSTKQGILAGVFSTIGLILLLTYFDAAILGFEWLGVLIIIIVIGILGGFGGNYFELKRKRLL
jgi:hypothetical protein